MSDVIALLLADLHLSHKAPVARSVEPDWLGAMDRQLAQLRKLADDHKGCPVFFGGDCFDRPTPPPALINFALDALPFMVGVFGQHDTIHHSEEDLHKTAFWTLVKAKKIEYLRPGYPLDLFGSGRSFRARGFAWGVPIKPCPKPHDLVVEIAVVHKYIWIKGCGYPGAPPEQRLKFMKGQFAGYDCVVTGDNHTPFDATIGKTKICNVGGFFRRRSDEVNYKPSVGLLMQDGTIKRHYFDCSADKFADPATIIKEIEAGTGADLRDFTKELASLSDAALDWPVALRRFMKKRGVAKEVWQKVLKALEG